MTGADLEVAILKVIYNGFGNDAARLQAKYGLSDDVFRRVTNMLSGILQVIRIFHLRMYHQSLAL